MQTTGTRPRNRAHGVIPKRSSLPEPTDRTRAGDHVVQFYESDDFVNEAVTRYLAEGLDQGQPLIVVATAGRMDAIGGRLRDRGYDVDGHVARSEAVLIDAREALTSAVLRPVAVSLVSKARPSTSVGPSGDGVSDSTTCQARG